jgi:hypothetical protein
MQKYDTCLSSGLEVAASIPHACVLCLLAHDGFLAYTILSSSKGYSAAGILTRAVLDYYNYNGEAAG